MLQMRPHRFTLAAITLSIFGVLPAVGQTINEDLKFYPNDATPLDRFGHSIAVGNGIIAVGAPNEHWNDVLGSAYLFDLSTGMQIAKLLPTDGIISNLFGFSIAIDNNVVVVGAPRAHYGGLAGSAYIFDASTGLQIAKLLPDDSSANDQFGYSVAIDNGIVVIGAPRNAEIDFASGAVYTFDVSTGKQIAKLLPIDGQFEDLFGNSIAIDNGIIAIGAWGDDDNSYWSGSAYLFDLSSGVQIAKLLPNDGASGDYFGYSIAINNGIVAVGAIEENDFDSGSVYLFDVLTGLQTARLYPSDGVANDQFGTSIAFHNGIIAVGAIGDDDNGLDSGSAYLFDAISGQQIAKLLTLDGSVGHQFGSAIAINSGAVIAGARGDDYNGIASGSAYLFSTEITCRADLDHNDALNFFDVSAFLIAYNAQDPIADFTSDGNWDFFDISAFLSAYLAGCP